MNDDKIQRAIEFLLQSQAQSQAESAARQAEFAAQQKEYAAQQKEYAAQQQEFAKEFAARQVVIEENFNKFQVEDEKLQTKLDRLSETVRRLAVLGQNLVQVAEMHSRRLDGLEGLQSH